MEIIYTSKFVRAYKKLPSFVKDAAERLETLFRHDPFDSRLKTHKLKGRFKDFYAFSLTQKYRILFEFSKDKRTAYFHAAGDHDVYQ